MHTDISRHPYVGGDQTSPIASLSITSFPLPEGRCTRRTTIDDHSILVSETESFREREAELCMVKKRFAATEAQRCPNTPRSSKFREEFDLKSSASEVSTTSKTSALVRLARLASQSYDGTTGMEELLGVPLLEVTPDAGLGPLDNDEVSNVWEKAVKRAADAKSKESATNLNVTDSKQGHDRKKSQLSQDSKGKGSIQFPRSLSWRKKGNTQDVPDDEMKALEKVAAEHKRRFEERMTAKERVWDSWEAELQATAEKAKAKSRNIMHKIKETGPDRRYPRSWSKFPSHSRSDRVSSAANDDGVDQQDFAMNAVLANGEPVWYHSKRKNPLYHHDGDEHESHNSSTSNTILGKIQAKVEEKMYELDTSSDQVLAESTDGRRSSMNLMGSLEYPELEILSLTEGTITQKQLEHQVDTEIKDDVREQRKHVGARTCLDGSLEIEYENNDEDDYDELELSIADPRFYDDCLVDPTLEDNDRDGGHGEGEGASSKEIQPRSEKKGKFSTWSIRDWNWIKNGRVVGGRARSISLGTAVLRHSTDECRCELEPMEKVERERALKAVDEARA